LIIKWNIPVEKIFLKQSWYLGPLKTVKLVTNRKIILQFLSSLAMLAGTAVRLVDGHRADISAHPSKGWFDGKPMVFCEGG